MIFCNTSHVDSGDQYPQMVVEEANYSVFPYIDYNRLSTSMRSSYGNMFIEKCEYYIFYQFYIDNYLQNQINIVKLFIMGVLGL